MDEPPGAQPEQHLLVAFLHDRDAECPNCKYNVRNLLTPRCPECGESLVLQLGIAEPKMGSLIAGLIGLSAGLGLNGLLLVYWAFVMLFASTRGVGGWGKFVLTIGIGFIVFLVLLSAWLKGFRWLRAQSKQRRIILSAGCWFLSLADTVIFALAIR